MSLLASVLLRGAPLGPDSPVSGSVLLTDPPIVLLKPRPRPFGPASYLAGRHPRTPFVFLRQMTWSYEGWPAALALAARYHAFRRTHQNSRLVILANTLSAERRLAALGVDVLFASSNMFLDETIFRPLPGMPREHQAIYNAQLNPYKRHHLAREIASCAYITYLPAFQDAGERRRRIEAFCAGLPRGHVVLNERADDNFRTMNELEVNAALARAHVGLCLSKVEGQMYASVEYLLAGLPVVTTQNEGGRDIYLHPDTAIVVKDDPRQVRDATEALLARAIPPAEVRRLTLELISRDRHRFNRFIEGLSDGARSASDPRWSFRYMHKLVRQLPLAELEAEALGR